MLQHLPLFKDICIYLIDHLAWSWSHSTVLSYCVLGSIKLAWTTIRDLLSPDKLISWLKSFYSENTVIGCCQMVWTTISDNCIIWLILAWSNVVLPDPLMVVSTSICDTHVIKWSLPDLEVVLLTLLVLGVVLGIAGCQRTGDVIIPWHSVNVLMCFAILTFQYAPWAYAVLPDGLDQCHLESDHLVVY